MKGGGFLKIFHIIFITNSRVLDEFKNFTDNNNSNNSVETLLLTYLNKIQIIM